MLAILRTALMNQKGITPLFILLLVFGIILGTYAIQQNTTYKSFAKVTSESEKIAEKCGFSKNELIVPVYPITIGENGILTDPECQELLKTQTAYFAQYIEAARKKAAEEAAANNLKFENDTFVVDPDKDLSEEEKGEAEKKAAQLNEALGSKIKEAAGQNNACKDKTGDDAIECNKETQQVTQVAATAAQVEAMNNAVKKLEAILAGEAAGKCVKADLGVTPFLEAQRLKRKNGENDEDRRLLLCSGDNDPKQLKWRVLVGGMKTGETRTIQNEDGTTEIKTNTNSANDEDECSSNGEAKDCGADAERIYGLHGKDPAATDTPPTLRLHGRVRIYRKIA